MRSRRSVALGCVVGGVAVGLASMFVGCNLQVTNSSSATGDGGADLDAGAADGAAVPDGQVPGTDGAAPDGGPPQPPPVARIHIVHATSNVGPVSLCFGAVTAPTADPALWVDLTPSGKPDSAVGTLPIPPGWGHTAGVPAPVVEAGKNTDLVIMAYPLTPEQFAAARAGDGAKDGPVGDSCAALYGARQTNGGLRLGHIPKGTVVPNSAVVVAAVNTPAPDGGVGGVGLQLTPVDATRPGDPMQVGVQFVHHALGTVAPLTPGGPPQQLTVAIGAPQPGAGGPGTCPFNFQKLGSALYPNKAPNKTDTPLGTFAGPGPDGGAPMGRMLAVGVELGGTVSPLDPTKATAAPECGFAMIPFDAIAKWSTKDPNASALGYFRGGQTFTIVAVGDYAKMPLPPTDPNYFTTNWFRFLAFANN